MPGTPGSRWFVRADREAMRSRGLQIVTTERPGYGRSTRLPGRRFAEHGDDVARILDHLAIDRVHALVRDGDEAGLRSLLDGPYTQMRADPLAGFTAAMPQAPASDQAVMTDPRWRAMQTRGLRAAFAAGIDGWIDETLAIFADWTDVDLTAVRTSITWWHGGTDRNTPVSAAQRLVDRLPHATLRTLGAAGHLEPYRREEEILAELLARG
ncbi:MAG TPA: hypothetical protein VGN37_26870 [Actinocatenispora sp.]